VLGTLGAVAVGGLAVGVVAVEVVGASEVVVGAVVVVLVGVVPVSVSGVVLVDSAAGTVPSPAFVEVSPTAAPTKGAPSVAAVSPPPARADRTARSALRRARFKGVMRACRSSRGRPIIVVGAAVPQIAGYAHRDSYRQRTTNR
jgi:hypothetical protein